MIDLRSIRHLVAVADHPTVQAAADALHLTQPALTRSIARLEDRLGARLFDRSGRKLVLTELGERLVARGDELLRSARELEEEVALWRGLGTGEVRIGVDPDSQLERLSGVLEHFVPGHPQVEVTVRSGYTETLLPMLLDGDLHFLVADPESAAARADLIVEPLPAERIFAAVKPDHPLADETIPEVEAFMGFPLAGAATAPRFDRWKAEQGEAAIGRPFMPSLVCDNYEVLVRLAERADAIVFGPESVMRGYERQGRLKVTDWPLDAPPVQPAVIRTRDRSLSPAAEHLIELFRSGSHSAPGG